MEAGRWQRGLGTLRNTPLPLRSVSIMWAEGIREDEASTVVQTVRDVLKVIYEVAPKFGLAIGPTAIRPFGTWVIPSMSPGQPYSGTHWYVDTAFDQARQQVVGPRFLELVRDEPWQRQNPHFDVAVVDRDLTDDEGSFALSSVLPGTATVLSVHRLRVIEPSAIRLAALRRLVVHSFGHVLGLVDCEDECAMRPAGTADELVRRVEDESALGVLLCPSCRRVLMHSVVIQRLAKN